jgi:hypothetical protein
MKNLIFFFFTLMSLTFISCNQSYNNHDSQHKHDSQDHHHHEIDHHDELPVISLQDGNPWKVPSHMHLVIKQMQQISMDANISMAQKAISLDAQINELTSNCTMVGEAHDELHKILLPLIDAVEQMSGADAQTSKSGFNLVLDLLELYDINFILGED